MAKFVKASEDVEKLFDKVIDETTIPQWLKFEVFSNKKQKELYKIMKMNEIVEILTEGVNFAVVFNEEILEQLPQNMQEMAMHECLAGVSVSETDTVSLEKPDFNTYTGVLNRYGDKDIIVLHESVKSLYDAKKQKEEEEKALTKGKRGRKSKNSVG